METLKTIVMRKSTRNFLSDQIRDEDLDKILRAGYAAPCGKRSYNTMHITVVQKQVFMDKLTSLVAKTSDKPKTAPLFGAPTFIVLSSAENAVTNVQYSNVACVIENMALAATDLNLGCLHIWGAFKVLREDKELIKHLNLPEGFVPLAGIAIGYSSDSLDTSYINQHEISINFIK